MAVNGEDQTSAELGDLSGDLTQNDIYAYADEIVTDPEIRMLQNCKRVQNIWKLTRERDRLCHGHLIRGKCVIKRRRILRGRFTM